MFQIVAERVSIFLEKIFEEEKNEISISFDENENLFRFNELRQS